MSESELSGRAGEFFVLAEALRAFKAGPLADHPSDRALARAAGVAPTTIGDWLRGQRFPQDIGKVLIVVRMVRDEAVVRGIPDPGSGSAGLLEEDRWRAARLAIDSFGTGYSSLSYLRELPAPECVPRFLNAVGMAGRPSPRLAG